MSKSSPFVSISLRLLALTALAALPPACGDDSKPNMGDATDGGDRRGDGGDGDGGDGDQASMDASMGGDGDQQQGDGDQQQGDGDASFGDGDGGVIDLDAAPDGEVVDPFEELPDAGPDGSVISEDEKLAFGMEAKLRKCKLVTGDGWFNVGLVEDDLDRCIARCITAPTTFCSHLTGRLCQDKITPFTNCLAGCKDVPTTDFFLCADGKTRIPRAAVCDDGALEQRCPGGEDEANCPDTFTCDNGDVISAKFVCDGTFVNGDESVGGCRDQSDEKQDCAVFCGRVPQMD